MNGTMSYSGTYRHYFTWKVPKFFSLSSETGYFLQSAEFRLAGDIYCLRLYPTGIEKTIDYDVDVLLVRLASSVAEREHTKRIYRSYEKDFSYEIGCKCSTGEEFLFYMYDCPVKSVGRSLFSLKRSELEINKDTYVPNGDLTVYCIIIGELSVLPFHGEEEQKGVDKLQSDYKRLMLEGAESDACLVVRGKEFQAHKCVLRARSPVFEAMFRHETAEKESGRVTIDDLKSDRFQDFLEYLYTGRVESFSDDNVFELYMAADKYDMPTLKSECVEYMGRSLSVDSICDVVTVALRHNEKDLMALAVEFFKRNLTSIFLTAKWQQYMRKNITRSNELLIKAFVPGKE